MHTLKYLLISILLSITLLSATESSKTWLAPDAAAQLRRESVDDQMGHGRLFVPTMSSADWEPVFKIYNADGNVTTGLKTGTSHFLKPGKYRMVIGSASDSYDQFQKEIVIKEQETVIVEPQWSGLIIKVIDENREGVRMGYELFHSNSEISLGVKYSKADDEYDDTQTTWLLPPGKYKFVKYGESYNTIFNFATFDLKVGELKKITIVKDSKTGFIIGAGELPEEQFEFVTGKDWRNYLYFRGQLSYNGNNDVSNNDHESILDFKCKIDNHIRYDRLPYYLSLRQTIETGLNKSNGDDVTISADEFKFDNTAIYYFTKVIGFYTELSLSSKIFPSTIYFEQPKTVQTNGLITENNASEFQLSPSFYPLILSEEAGLNFSFIKTADANLYIRTGIGFVQKQNTDVYSKTAETDSTISVQSVANEQIKGYVLAGGLDLQLPGNITYTSEGNFLYSLDIKDSYELRFDNNLKFKFLKYVSLDYTLNLKYNSTDKYINYNNRLALEFSYYLNY